MPAFNPIIMNPLNYDIGSETIYKGLSDHEICSVQLTENISKLSMELCYC
jgi:hypothetical protein